MNHPDEILKSWAANASNWISTIDGSELESRTLVTNAAIVNTILKYTPKNVLDIGCGEGWLTRELQSRGIAAHGIDAIPALVENAITKGGNHYDVCSYEDFIKGRLAFPQSFDAAVINFALIDKVLSEQLLYHLATSLESGSVIFIQTLHPISVALNDDYETGWKEGSWNGLRKEFVLPYKWYFRTLGDWLQLFSDAGLQLQELKEPLHPVTKKPASVIFVLAVQ